MYSGFDPINIDTQAAEDAVKEVDQLTEEAEQRRILQEQQAAAMQQREEAAETAAKDPRNQEGGGGFKGAVKELQSAIGGGLQDSASSIVTFPERAIDMFSGEMQEEQATEEGYGAEWDDWFVDDANPIETKTWWGGAIRSLVHFGSLAAAIIPAASAAGVGAATTVVGSLARGAGIGAVSDILSKYSQEENGLQILRDRFNFIDTPLATNDLDHPAVKTLKNVVEGMGIGAVFDGFSILVGKGVKKVRPGKKPGDVVVTDAGNEVTIKAHKRLNEIRKQLPDNPYQDEVGSYGNVLSNLNDDLANAKRGKGGDAEAIQKRINVLKAEQTEALKKYNDWKPDSKYNDLLNEEQELENLLKQAANNQDDPVTKAVAREQSVKDQITQKAVIKQAEDFETMSKAQLIERIKEEFPKASPEKQESILQQYGISRESLEQPTPKPSFSAYKNKPIADPWQAAPTSNGKPFDVRKQLSRSRKEWGAENGSTDSLTTPVQLERTAINAEMAEEHLKEVLSDFMSDQRIQTEIADAKAKGKSLMDVWGEAAEKMQRIIEGRNTSDVSTEEFWKEFNLDKDRIDDREVWKSGNVVAADLIIGSLVKELRDLGIAGREIFEIADVADIDGPAKAMYDKLIAGLTQIKLAKMTKSADFRNLGAGAVREVVDTQVAESVDAFRLAMKLAGNSKDDDLFRAIFETVSMSNDIHNVTDFDAWIRKKLKGGDFNGQAKTGALIRELQGVMINSVLSGPKTPARAILGTSTATFLRPLSQVLGATLSGDAGTKRASLAAVHGMVEAIPEAWTLFKTKLNSYWTGDVASIKSRFNEITKGDEQWEMYRDWIENSDRASLGDKGTFYLANMARAMNNNKFLTYSTKIMAATDDTFGYILARSRAKEKAMRLAMDQLNKGNITEITPDLLKNAEDRFYGQITDADGNITDAATIFAKKEATLTTDLTGFSKGLNEVFDKAPWAKPFFLFARTGVNGLALTAKHTPGFNFLVKEWNDIAFATPDNLQDVLKYGIETADDLANAKALQRGRLAIGSGIISMASIHFMNGGLTGNGPTDRQKRQVWIDAGWKPRSIKLGDVWVSYDAFEPFNLILSTIGDIGDHSQLMGEEWTEDNLQKLAVVMMQGISSKSYLAGMQQFVDLFAGKPGQFERIIAGLANNTIPMSSMRNELGKLFNPYMKELNSGIGDAIRNRNLISERLGVKELPTKYDMLNGQPIKDWDFPTRMFNMFSPVQFNLDQGPGRKLLFDSGYDLRMSTYSAPDGTDLKDNATVRSMFMKAIGDQNIEAQLNKLAKNRKVQMSLAAMQNDLAAGRREIDPRKAYVHNTLIHQIIEDARRRAWAKVQRNPEVKALQEEERRLSTQNLESMYKTSDYNKKVSNVLDIYR